MADDAAPAKGDDAPTQDTTPTDDSVASQAENPDAVKNALAAERSRAKAAEKRANELAAKVEQFESANQSELEKLANKVTKAEQAKAEAEGRLLRFEVAAEKQVPADALDLLTGNSREELEAKADKLLELVKSRTETTETPDFDGGPREPAPESKTPDQAHADLVLALLGANNT